LRNKPAQSDEEVDVEVDAKGRVKEREAELAALMRAANAGDAAAYKRFLAALSPILRSAARRGFQRVGISDSDVEDVVQETLLAIHLKRHTWDANRPIGPWMHAIVRNKLIDNVRRRGSRQTVPIEDFENFLPAGEPEAAVEVRDVEPYIAALPDRQRSVLRAILQEEISIAITAKRLNISEGAVRVALHRGLAAVASGFRRNEI
jgi:RNA polymerase sigma-70 factor (ECF subfamily)